MTSSYMTVLVNQLVCWRWLGVAADCEGGTVNETESGGLLLLLLLLLTLFSRERVQLEQQVHPGPGPSSTPATPPTAP